MRSRRRPPGWLRLPLGPVIALATVALLAAAAAAPDAFVRVPDVGGVTRDRAVDRLTDLGLSVELRAVDRGGRAGFVVGQRPATGGTIRRGDTVVVEISRGAPQIDVPDLVERRVDDAIEAVRGAGLSVSAVSYRRTGGEPGVVIASDPRAGTTVDQGAGVRLVVSAEP